VNRRFFARNIALGGLVLVPALHAGLDTAEAAVRKRKPQRRPVPAPKTKQVTKVVTKTFANSTEIRILDQARANPYPTAIEVTGFDNARLTDVNVTLDGFTHDRPFDVALMLVSPSGKGAVLLHNVGGNSHVSGLVVTLDDQAADSMPTNADIRLSTGTFKPTVNGSANDLFFAPAPQGVSATTLDTFNGEDPNGAWRLYAVDDAFLYGGSIAFGWRLTVTVETTVTVTVPRKRRKVRKPRRR
jgi:subtilisin-like proprotein convertase family protein